MNFVEFEGKDPEEAIAQAQAYFKVPPEELEIEIVSLGSSGLFGLLGGKKAKIRAAVKAAAVAAPEAVEAAEAAEAAPAAGTPGEAEAEGGVDLAPLAQEVLATILEKMGENCSVQGVQKLNQIHLVVEGEDAEIIRQAMEEGKPIPKPVEHRLRQATAKIRAILRFSQEPVSLETPVGEEESGNLGEFIEDESIPPPDDATSRHLLEEQIRSALDVLNERERAVLELRYGLRDGRAHTLEEVGRELGVTRERVRQIEAKALRKLRHPVRSRKLRDYLG